MVGTVSILDDFDQIKHIDKSNMREAMNRLPENCEDALKLAEKLNIPKKLRITEKISIKYKNPEKILVVGMGGSAISGDILRTWLRGSLPIPIEVCREYYLPAYADNSTLVLAISYSGNTEETLSGFIEAIQRKCMVIAITSGGLLLDFCQKLRIPFIKVPSELPPRAAIPYLFFPLVTILKKLDILKLKQREIRETIDLLGEIRELIRAETPTKNNPAKKLAIALMGTIPAIYGFREYESIALRIKTQLNENSKIPAKNEVFPELSHNEIVGWDGPRKLTKMFSAVLIRDPDETPEIRSRIETMRALNLNKKASKVLEIKAIGKSKLARMFSVMYIGDYASLYLAILCGVDPTPIEVITKLKHELAKRVNIIEKLNYQVEKWATK
ncbi:MAG: bifunctional phosphoglucose/phosphomannose isomerase [Euryarchaeota archaeon]|nr:bifunctional phosphoglucose/phosphomannose isomerase [Euryarchaeota archaeon]